jgi:hypothetical protein
MKESDTIATVLAAPVLLVGNSGASHESTTGDGISKISIPDLPSIGSVLEQYGAGQS